MLINEDAYVNTIIVYVFFFYINGLVLKLVIQIVFQIERVKMFLFTCTSWTENSLFFFFFVFYKKMMLYLEQFSDTPRCI